MAKEGKSCWIRGDLTDIIEDIANDSFKEPKPHIVATHKCPYRVQVPYGLDTSHDCTHPDAQSLELAEYCTPRDINTQEELDSFLATLTDAAEPLPADPNHNPI